MTKEESQEGVRGSQGDSGMKRKNNNSIFHYINIAITISQDCIMILITLPSVEYTHGRREHADLQGLQGNIPGLVRTYVPLRTEDRK